MKKIICYFSVQGNTRAKAKQLAQVTGADLFEIVPETAYTEADLDWRDKQSRSTIEMTDPSSRPAIVDGRKDFSSYDTVYIGFPIWWGVAPHAVKTFIESNDLAGRKIIVFATSGGSGIDNALKDLRETYPSLNFAGGSVLNGEVTRDIDF